MGTACEYCRSRNEDGLTNCKNCGAPLPMVSGSSTPARHVHQCPVCGHKLLALASPNCNYCGERLPQDYITAREADLKRINDLNIPVSAASFSDDEAAGGSASGMERLLASLSKMR
jgi:DNA-directed RNA polymerase subunit RPC12/RpoP